MPRLRVTAGPSTAELTPIAVNSGIPRPISSDAFEGQVLVYIKGFTDEEGNVLDSEYFHREDRQGITWSIQVQGRFLKPYSADDVMFGNTFDRPLKLPWGSGAALRFMKFIDPTLDHDLSSQTKPWALSPLIATMPHFSYTHLDSHASHTQHLTVSQPRGTHNGPGNSTQSGTMRDAPRSAALSTAAQSGASHSEADASWPLFPPSHSIADDTTDLHLALRVGAVRPSAPRLASSDSGSSISSGSSADSQASSKASSSCSFPRRHGSPRSDCGSLLSADSHAEKKKNRLSAGSFSSISSRLSDKAEKKEHKKLEKAIRKVEKHDKTLQNLDTAAKRQAYFRDADKRREVVFGPEDLITVDFCYGFIEFAPTLSLRLPGGISFDLVHYWDGQPVRFVCCERKRSPNHLSHSGLHGKESKDDEDPWGRVLWCVCIELAEDDGEQSNVPQQTQAVDVDDVD